MSASAAAETRASAKAMPKSDGSFRLASAALARRLKAGETLFAEGEPSRYCYEVIDGVIKEYSTLEDGTREISDFYSRGEIVGIGGREEQAQTAEAVTDCLVRCISREMLLKNARTTPEISMLLMDLLMRRLDRSRERAILVSRRSASQRVAAFLRVLAAGEDNAAIFSIPMSRQDIADYLGLTIETVCRTLTEFKRVGAIAMPSARTFSIRDGTALAAAAEAPERLH